MAMMRESWTDERLDDLNGKVDHGFERLDGDVRGLRSETRTEFTALRSEMKDEFAALRSEMKGEFILVNERFEKVEGRIDKRFDQITASFDLVHERLDRLYRAMLQLGGGMLAVLAAALIGLVAT
jgi:hypothetical protein